MTRSAMLCSVALASLLAGGLMMGLTGCAGGGSPTYVNNGGGAITAAAAPASPVAAAGNAVQQAGSAIGGGIQGAANALNPGGTQVNPPAASNGSIIVVQPHSNGIWPFGQKQQIYTAPGSNVIVVPR